MSNTNIHVFISYSHDSAEHDKRVLAFANRLRADGIDATIDQYQSAPPEGWQLWMENQISHADFILLVCTETYHRRVERQETAGYGLGAIWESTIIYTHIYNTGLINVKFIPVILSSENKKYIPLPLQPTTYPGR